MQNISPITVFSIGFFALIATPSLSDEGLNGANLVQYFLDGALEEQASQVDCTLTDGTKTTCLSLTVKPEPVGFETGPYCPATIEDGAQSAGIWIYKGEIVDVDGQFIQSLPTLYNDGNWQLFDETTGKVKVTDTQIACEAAARPDVDPEYQNHCVECSISYIPSDMTTTYLIPIEPVVTDNVSPRIARGLPVGLSFNGIRLDQPAPVEAILGAYTIAAFDDCGGHVNPHVGYHTHIVTDCHASVDAADDESTIIGIAMDGFAIMAPLSFNELNDVELDECNGHSSPELGYHYHAGEPGENQILPCLKGATMQSARR